MYKLDVHIEKSDGFEGVIDYLHKGIAVYLLVRTLNRPQVKIYLPPLRIFATLINFLSSSQQVIQYGPSLLSSPPIKILLET